MNQRLEAFLLWVIGPLSIVISAVVFARAFPILFYVYAMLAVPVVIVGVCMLIDRLSGRTAALEAEAKAAWAEQFRREKEFKRVHGREAKDSIELCDYFNGLKDEKRGRGRLGVRNP